MIVKLLGSVLKGQVPVVIKKTINTDLPFPFAWLTGYLAILMGAGMTFLIQSSSVFTSTMTPLIGVLRWYPIPFAHLPILLAKELGSTSAKYHWLAIFYLVIFFCPVPLTVFDLSLAGWPVLVGMGVPIILLVLLVVLLKLLQSHCPCILPSSSRPGTSCPYAFAR
ncbi:hypothetical protein HJG60_011460 [Phyllostomus discolor]|uniref:Sodium-dependent phosphate transport protein 2B n=1 Tax=Phyllostomus discolor TaxID=89673 RepID=A0A834E0T0_9CHIR|nr:hypothetical protein HJG60_011460 [Phyllostomus discolor]